ncbi:hypothetical protein KJ762_12925 [bacterium]|nr:hypothetical protein [bacterium]MBU1064042.1 hypothetical protein [bacterium]MBU1635395.1 hypothetical protein [bacterium]MBU1874363.1 hypothetical protein [bacterium]
MKKFVSLFMLSILLVSSSCMMKLPDKSDMPSWNVNLEIPLMKTTITADDLFGDSLFVGVPYGTSRDSIFAYEDQVEIEKVEVGDQLNIEDINQSFSQSIDDIRVKQTVKQFSSQLDPVGVDPITQSVNSLLGTISLDDTDPIATDPVLMSEVIDFSGIAENSQMTIPQSTDIPVIYRNITFEDFKNADFATGVLEISINNAMIVELGAPLTVRLLNADSTKIVGADNDSAKAVWDTGILTGSSDTKTINLTGKILPESIILEITGVVSGSGTTNVTNNSTTCNSSFIVDVQARKLEVISAEAIVQSQTIDTTDVILLAESEDKVQTAKIQNGTIGISIVNNLPLNSQFELTITSIDVSDAAGIQAFTEIINLTANQPADETYDLTNAYLVMDVNNQQVEYSYQVITEDTGTDKVQVSEDDGVTVNIAMYGKTVGEQMTFSEFEGIVTQEPIVDMGEIDVSTESKITSAVISSGTMVINIHNTANSNDQNVPELTLDIPEFVDQTSNSIHVVRDLFPEPNTTTILLDLNGYTLHPNTVDVSADSFNQNITYTSTVVVPSGVITAYDLQGAYDVDINVSELIFSEVTGYFVQDAIVDRNVITLEEATKIDEAFFNTGELALSITNHIGAVAAVKFRVTELVNIATNLPLQHTINLTDNTDPIVEIIPLNDYKLVIPLTDFTADQEIHYRSTVSLPSDQEMTLFIGNEIDVDVSLQNISFSSVAGYIDTVTINIDSVEQSITALPEELNGINLNSVEITINFDSNIDVPVVLDLVIVSLNANGDRAESVIRQNITENPLVVIPNASELINLKPDKIISYGTASVGGEGFVTTAQFVQGTMDILVPMSFEVADDAAIEIAPELMKDDIPDELEEIALYANLENQFEFNGFIRVLGAKDTLYFLADSPIAPDTIATFQLIPDSSSQEVIFLDESQFALFTDSLYIMTKIDLLSNTDNAGNPIPTRLFKSDSLTIQIYSKIKGFIDLAGKDN